MIEPLFELADEVVPELGTWIFTGRLWKVKGVTRIPVAAFTAMTMRIYPEHLADDVAAEILPATSILNTGRGTLVEVSETIAGQAVPVTRLTIAFQPGDSVIKDPAHTVTVAPRRRIPGERHVALVEATYESGRTFRREIVWTVKNLKKVG
jgi:hypothetical protein